MLSWLAIAVAGGIGALARFELTTAVARISNGRFPLGTLAVNSSGSFLAGLAYAVDPNPDLQRIVVAGFLGGFTTFSTWMVETAHLLEREPKASLATLNVAAMIALGLVGATIGMAIGS